MQKLYVIDDDVGFLEIMQEVTPAMGFQLVALSALEQFKAAYGGESDAIVMTDMIMPEADGIDLVNWLSQGRRPGGVILVTGFTEHYTRLASVLAEAKGLRVLAKLTKPIKLALLRETLAAARAALPNAG